jgi:hypothetical protein
MPPVARLLGSSVPTTLSFDLTVTLEEGIQGIGSTIGGVNAQLVLIRFCTALCQRLVKEIDRILEF